MRNLKLVVAYDGSGFQGWQVQKDARTVQGELEKALTIVLGHHVNAVASGRTDTGVHALGQVVGVRTTSSIPATALKRALRGLLPADIAVTNVEEVCENFHARYAAKNKRYCYIIDTSGTLNPFLRHYVLSVEYNLDEKAMKIGAEYILGKHDFSAFMGSGSSVKTTIREVTSSAMLREGPWLCYQIEGSGFLRHMVRNIVGTLLMIGRGSMAPDEIPAIISSKDRSMAGPTAPPQGLYLVGVEY